MAGASTVAAKRKPDCARERGRRAVALRGGAARGLQQQPELVLVIAEGVDRARQRRDRLLRAVRQLQRGAELGRDLRVAVRGDRRCSAAASYCAGLQLDRAELTCDAALVLGRRRLAQRPAQVAQRDLGRPAPARAGRRLAQDPHGLRVPGGICLVAVDRDAFGVGARLGQQLRGARVAAGAIAGRELRVDGLAHERVHEREPPAAAPTAPGAAGRRRPARRAPPHAPPATAPPPAARHRAAADRAGRRARLPAAPPPAAGPLRRPPGSARDVRIAASSRASAARLAASSSSSASVAASAGSAPSPRITTARASAVAAGWQAAQAGERGPADGARGLALDQRPRWPRSGRPSPTRAAARRAGTGCRR